MQVFVINHQKDLVIHPDQAIHLVKLVVDGEGKKYNEVSVHFIDIDTISEMHLQYFNDPSPTDCISFPMDDEESDSGYKLMGDVFVCPKVAVKYALKHDMNPYHEVSLYVIHGLLHLMGYDDIDPIQRRAMRKAEKRHMHDLIQYKAMLAADTEKLD